MIPSDVPARLDSDDLVHLVLPVGTPMAQLIRAQSIFLDLLREVSRSVARTIDDPVTWVVKRVSESSADYALAPVPVVKTLPPGSLHTMVEAVPAGIGDLVRGAQRPRYFSDRALELTATLGAVITKELPSIKTRNGAAVVEITKAAAVHAQRVLDQPYVVDVGTVEGKLETLNVHGRRQFVIFDELTAARIECHFGHRVASLDVAAGIERRVAVTGEIRSRESGEIISVIVHPGGFEILPLDDELPTADDVRGILAG